MTKIRTNPASPLLCEWSAFLSFAILRVSGCPLMALSCLTIQYSDLECMFSVVILIYIMIFVLCLIFSDSLHAEAEAVIHALRSPLSDHATVTVHLESEEDVKPPPTILVPPETDASLEDGEDQEIDQSLDRSLSPSLSSVDMRLSLSPPLPHSEECFNPPRQHLRTNCACSPDVYLLLKREHQIILSNQKQYGIYIKEKREALKRRQHLEEELLKSKIKVEKLKALKLRRDLPEYSVL